MGSQQFNSTTSPLNETYNRANTIRTQYYKQVFTQHKISATQFKERLHSIRKRSTYLQYPWARELEEFIKLSNKDKLYTEYKYTLKENCLRQGKKEKIFCPINLRKSFLAELLKKTEQSCKTMTQEQLSSIIEECKAFLMVTCWLHQLVSLQRDAQNQPQNQVKKVTINCQNKEIYEILLNLTERYYKEQFKVDRAYQPILKIADSNIREIMVSLQKTRGFHQRQVVIMNLIKILESDTENGRLNFIGVCQTLGKEKIAAHLHVIQEVGTYEAFNTDKYLQLCMDGCLNQANGSSDQSTN